MKMKNLLFVSMAMFLIFSTGCKENENLSDFILGDWETQMLLGGSSVMFHLDFKSNECIISGMLGGIPMTPISATYTVDNKLNKIEISGGGGKKSGDPIMGTFLVDWKPNGKTMTWTSDNLANVLTYIWTRK